MTIIELLIVVAIVLILAAIVIPNFMESSRPLKVSRVKNDMRSLATALESYYGDHRSYPATVSLNHFVNNSRRLETLGGGNAKTVHPGAVGLVGITTPVAYVTHLFPDPAAPEKSVPFAYYTKGDGWILYSPGPDEDYDLEPAVDYDGTTLSLSQRLISRTYDPTNGTKSDGDVWRIKQ